MDVVKSRRLPVISFVLLTGGSDGIGVEGSLESSVEHCSSHFTLRVRDAELLSLETELLASSSIHSFFTAARRIKAACLVIFRSGRENERRG